MEDAPVTRPSLLLRVRDPRNEQAWEEFLEIYEPLVYRLARRKGFQDADARELTQEVFFAVSRAVDRWDPDRTRGTFRGWLFRIARNAMINHLNRQRRHPRGTGDTGMNEMLAEQPAANDEETAIVELECRRGIFQWAAEQVRRDCQETTWRAFWLTSVEGQEIKAVAEMLGITPGAVYVARSRVMARLRKAIEELEGEERQVIEDP
jgi:RNA polymerase sigma-70 factor (ECF subfamily)